MKRKHIIPAFNIVLSLLLFIACATADDQETAAPSPGITGRDAVADRSGEFYFEADRAVAKPGDPVQLEWNVPAGFKPGSEVYLDGQKSERSGTDTIYASHSRCFTLKLVKDNLTQASKEVCIETEDAFARNSSPSKASAEEQKPYRVMIQRVDRSGYPDEIRLYVQVMDRAGNQIKGLAGQKKSIAENTAKNTAENEDKKEQTVPDVEWQSIAERVEGKERKITNLKVQELTVKKRTPRHYIFVLDYSGSMYGTHKRMENAVRSFVQNMPDSDSFEVVQFSHVVHATVPQSSSAAALNRMMTMDELGGGTALYDGMSEGLKKVQGSPDKKDTLIVFTDGYDNSSTINAMQLAGAVRPETETYLISYYGSNRDMLSALANITGGMSIPLDQEEDIEPVFQSMALIQSQGYLVTYKPEGGSPDSDRHVSLNVKIENEDYNTGRQVVMKPGLQHFRYAGESLTDRTLLGTLHKQNSAETDPAYEEQLKKFVNVPDGSVVEIISHADSTENDPYGLSRKRAEKTADTLAGLGLDQDKIVRTTGMGDMQQKHDNPDKQDWQVAENRRSMVRIRLAAEREPEQLTAASRSGAETACVQGPLNVDLTSVDTGAGLKEIRYRLNDSKLHSYTGPVRLEKTGFYTITYSGVDRVGNRETEKTLQFCIDNIAPQLRLSCPGSCKTGYPGKLHVIAEDSDSGLKSVQYSDDQKEWYDVNQKNREIIIERNGPVTVHLRAEDQAGNTAEKSFPVYVDGQVPYVAIYPDPVPAGINGRLFVKGPLTVRMAARDDTDPSPEIHYSINGSTGIYSGPVHLTEQKTYRIEAYSEDRYGNRSEPRVLVLTVDSTPPKSEIQRKDPESSD